MAQKSVEVGGNELGLPVQVGEDRRDRRSHAERRRTRVVEEGLLAVPIAGRGQDTGGFVEEAECPHAVGLAQRIDAPAGDQLEQHLGVAVGFERDALSFQIDAQRAKIVDLTVMDQRPGATAKRLTRSIGDVKDRQASVSDEAADGERAARAGIGSRERTMSGFIGTAMTQTPGRAQRPCFIDRPAALESNEESAHAAKAWGQLQQPVQPLCFYRQDQTSWRAGRCCRAGRIQL